MQIPCPSCGAVNRFPAERVHQGPRCGRCKAAIDATTPLDVNDDQLAQLVANTDVPVLVDFWAPWCGPCRSVAPRLVALAQRHAGRLVVAKVNTDEHKRTAAQLGVQAIPTLAVYRAGKLAHQQAGALPGPQLDALVAGFL